MLWKPKGQLSDQRSPGTQEYRGEGPTAGCRSDDKQLLNLFSLFLPSPFLCRLQLRAPWKAWKLKVSPGPRSCSDRRCGSAHDAAALSCVSWLPLWSNTDRSFSWTGALITGPKCCDHRLYKRWHLPAIPPISTRGWLIFNWIFHLFSIMKYSFNIFSTAKIVKTAKIRHPK